MSKTINAEIIESFTSPLENHPVYEAVESIEDLQCFMEHHVYSVWDFMSLLKYVQSAVAPASYPWVPEGDGAVRRFINELVLEEESDSTHQEGQFASHFELYHRAMEEIGANTLPSTSFLEVVRARGVDEGLAMSAVPKPARQFTSTTFQFIGDDKPHEVAAAFALGREHIVPIMFRSILERTGVSEKEAPIFHYYLKRHIHLDEGFHGPLSMRLLNGLCGNDDKKIEEAVLAAQKAVSARVDFWDGVLRAIKA